jgi:hypothetical protein
LQLSGLNKMHLSDDGGQQHEAERQKDRWYTLAYSAYTRRMRLKQKMSK